MSISPSTVPAGINKTKNSESRPKKNGENPEVFQQTFGERDQPEVVQSDEVRRDQNLKDSAQFSFGERDQLAKPIAQFPGREHDQIPSREHDPTEIINVTISNMSKTVIKFKTDQQKLFNDVGKLLEKTLGEKENSKDKIFLIIDNFYKEKIYPSENTLEFTSEFLPFSIDVDNEEKQVILKQYKDISADLNDINDILIAMFDFLLKMVLMQIPEGLAISDIGKEDIRYSIETQVYNQTLKGLNPKQNGKGFIFINLSKIKKLSNSKDYNLAFRGLCGFLKFINFKFHTVLKSHPDIQQIIGYYILIFHLLGAEPGQIFDYSRDNPKQDLIVMETSMILDMFDLILVKVGIFINVNTNINKSNTAESNEARQYTQDMFAKEVPENITTINRRGEKFGWLHSSFLTLFRLVIAQKFNDELLEKMFQGNSSAFNNVIKNVNFTNEKREYDKIKSYSKFWSFCYTPNYRLVLEEPEDRDYSSSNTINVNKEVEENIKKSAGNNILYYRYIADKVRIGDKTVDFVSQLKSFLKFLIANQRFAYVSKMKFLVKYKKSSMSAPPIIVLKSAKESFEKNGIQRNVDSKHPFVLADQNLIITPVTPIFSDKASEFLFDYVVNKKLNFDLYHKNSSHNVLDITWNNKDDSNVTELLVYEGTSYIDCKKEKRSRAEIIDLNDVLTNNIQYDLEQATQFTQSLLNYCMGYFYLNINNGLMYLYNDMVYFYNDRVYFSSYLWQDIFQQLVPEKPANPSDIFGVMKALDAGGILRFFYIVLSKFKQQKYNSKNFENKKECFKNIWIVNLSTAMVDFSKSKTKDFILDKSYDFDKICLEKIPNQ